MMISLSSNLAVICVLSGWIVGCAAGCGDGQYERGGQCCDPCPPGEYLTDFCSEDQKSACSPCEEGFYADKYNPFGKCKKCQTCQQDYTEKCTATTNTNCSCRVGFLCLDNVCSKCEENKCVSGEKPKRTESSSAGGLIEYSYQCVPACPDNAYLDAKEDICKLHRVGGESVNLILSIGFVLLSLTLLVFLSYICIKTLRKCKRKSKNQTEILAVSTTTNDFHLSKEESGLLIMQDESNNSFVVPHQEKVTSV